MHFLLPLIIGLSAAAANSAGVFDLNPTLEKFSEICRRNRRGAELTNLDEPEVGMLTFFPVLALQATQSRYSFRRVLATMMKTVEDDKDPYQHDHEQSVFGIKKRIKVAYYRGRLYIIDGHHRALISAYLGAKTIPAQIVHVFPHDMERAAFIKEMEDRGWAYWKKADGSPAEMVDLCAMIDDPNLQLARLLIRRVDVTVTNGHMSLSNSRGADLVIAVKINSDIAFFEKHLADALTRQGVKFDDSRKEKHLKPQEVEQYLRMVLTERARLPAKHPLHKILLLDRATPVADLPLEKLVIKHLQQADLCEDDLG